MKKSTIWTLVIIVVLILGVAWYAFSQSSSPVSQTTSNSTSTANTVATVNYFCASGTMSAAYASTSVNLAISDGRTMTLGQTMSGSGIRYESATGTTPDVVFQSEGNNALLTENNKITYNDCVAGTVAPSTAGMQTYTDGSNLFSFTYPKQFVLSGGDQGYTQNWRSGTTSTGMEFTVVTVPQSLQPKTNFDGAVFTFGTSADPDAVKGCLTDGNGNPVKGVTSTINGVAFTKLTYGDAGAGNLYDITSYRTVHNGQCYAAEYVVHSSQLGNYPASAGISAFNSSTIHGTLDSIAHSLIFLQ